MIFPLASSKKKITFTALILLMGTVIVSSNFLYQFALNEWITWGAFSYPFVFLITDLTNRTFGIKSARTIVYFGFALAVPLSIIVADIRIAIASGSAFLIAQLLDIHLFTLLRKGKWWKAPLVSSALASIIDSILFFSIAFYGTEINWFTLATGDQMIKWLMVVVALPVYRLLTKNLTHE